MRVASRAPKFRHHADGPESIASGKRPPFLHQTISRLFSDALAQSASNWIKWHNPEPRAVHNLTKAGLFSYGAPRNMEIHSGSEPMTSLTIDPNRDSQEIELSVVIPCLNEADTLADCVRTAQSAHPGES